VDMELGRRRGQTRPRSQGEVGRPAEEVRVSGGDVQATAAGRQFWRAEHAPLRPAAARKSPTCATVRSTLYYYCNYARYTWDNSTFSAFSPPKLIRSHRQAGADVHSSTLGRDRR